MLAKFSQWMVKKSKGWVSLTALILFVLFTILVLPNQTSSTDSEAESAGSPDLSFFYTPKDLYAMAEAYGAAGRRDYIIARFTFDVVWPIVYTVFLVIVLSWLSPRAFNPESRWQRVNLLPVGGALFDYLENLCTSLVMFRYPLLTPGVDLIASFATPVKWILLGVSFILMVFLGIKALFKPSV